MNQDTFNTLLKIINDHCEPQERELEAQLNAWARLRRDHRQPHPRPQEIEGWSDGDTFEVKTLRVKLRIAQEIHHLSTLN